MHGKSDDGIFFISLLISPKYTQIQAHKVLQF